MALVRICLLVIFGAVVHAQTATSGLVAVRISEGGRPIAARITVVDADGALAPVRAAADNSLAVRPGVVYTSTGTATIELAPGRYTVWASRGVEYSAERRAITVSASSTPQPVSLQLTREVRIPGWAGGDVHVHTREFSGHGDATARERAITLAGEGLQFAVATEHNVALGYDAAVRQLGLDSEVTLIRGVEFTTPQGHFNIFPIQPGATLPDSNLEWEPLWTALNALRPAVVVMNHPRDLHAGYRPMDAAHYVESTGEWRNGRAFTGNAIEVVNSGAMQSDPLIGVRDWMTQLKRGARIAAIGSSDSHDVATVQVGQARTYIKTASSGPPTEGEVVESIARGDSLVSYGLVTTLELDTAGSAVARVYGPSWNRVRRVQFYASGELIETRDVNDTGRGGLKWTGTLTPPQRENVWLVAVAIGDDVQLPFWSVAKPYQPSGPVATPMTLGISQRVFHR